MNNSTPEQDSADIQLATVTEVDPETLAAEKRYLAYLSTAPVGTRLWGYFKLSGPGWMQSALTLGSSSFLGSLFSGALLGVSILWVQPLAMLLGVMMMSALAYQTLSTGQRPFHAVSRFVHPVAAWAWALTSLLASVIWSLPQYALAGAGFEELFKIQTPSPSSQFLVGLGFLLVSAIVTWTYDSGSRLLRFYEAFLKICVAAIILSFLLVVLTAQVDWHAVWRGYMIKLPEFDNIDGWDVILGAFAAAVGINMTFLYPYSLQARGWGREHRGLARFDLATGMFIPFMIAVSCIVIVSGTFLHADYAASKAQYQQDLLTWQEQHTQWQSAPTSGAEPAKPKPPGKPGLKDLINRLDREQLVPSFVSRTVVPLGVVAMALSTMTTLMIVTGFIMIEVAGIKPHTWAYRLSTLLAGFGCLYPFLWAGNTNIKEWIVVPTSVICLCFMPVAYISFWILNNRRAYLGADLPTGWRRIFWNIVLGLGTLAVLYGAGKKLYDIL